MRFMLGGAALASIGSMANAGTFEFNQAEILFIKEMSDNFRNDNSQLGVFNGNKVLGDQTFAFMEGVLRNGLEFGDIDINDAALNTFGGKNDRILLAYFSQVPFLASDPNNINLSLNDAILSIGDNIGQDAFFLTQDAAIANVAAAGVLELALAKAPRSFCLDDQQCVGLRDDQGFGETVKRRCNNLNDDDNEIPSCDDFVTFFSLRWLMAYIGITYGIILLWVLYWTYPIMKKKCCGKQGTGGGGGAAKVGPYSEQDQLIINTLAVQCASAENLLFQATDLVQKARGMENIMAVEAKRESKIMVYTCQYLQAVCAIMVSLTHQYLDKKTNTPGEKFNMEDCTTRALQLEVLNYVRDRLQLAFMADMMTEKSLFRIAEGYAVLKKVTDSLVFVGFDIDRKFKDSLGDLKTPYVNLSEDAIFLGGVYKPAGQAFGTENLVNQPVCVTVGNADRRNLTPVSSAMYLSNSTKPSKMYDPKMECVTRGTGTCLSFNTMNGGQVGEGLQFFVRTFWGNEIAAIQSEAQRWLQVDGAMEQYLDNERIEREQRAGPVLKKSHNNQRRGGGGKRRRKHRNKDDKGTATAYSETDETATEMSGYTETSGWSVGDDNNYVYNVHAVVNQGLGIAGKPGIPYDKPGETPVKKGSKLYQWFEAHFPNYAEWPKFYTFVFVIMPLLIAIPMIAKSRKGAGKIDIDGNVAFKARAAGFGTSFLGVPAYYFLDGFVPEADDLVDVTDVSIVNLGNIDVITNELLVDNQFGGGDFKVFISNADSFDMFINDFDGASGRNPDAFIGEIQAGILVQKDIAALDGIRNQQLAQEITTTFLYGLMHNAGYFFGLVPLTLIRESLEILARKWPFIREIYPMSLWRELHMSMGLAGIFYVVFGATVFLVTALVGIGKSTPFGGLAGDPNIASFFDLEANVLYLRQLLLPAVPLLLLMKYAARGPPVLMRKYAPTIITKNYWEICYFLHYFTALTAIIMLVLYRPQVFYWMGATWGIVWGGNKIIRILRTRKTTIKRSNLVSYTVADGRNNAKKRSDVLRIELNVPSSFPSSARGQACWLTVPAVDYVAHPFTLAKVPDNNEKTIMFHIAVRYLEGDDVISYARPEAAPVKEVAIQTTPMGDPNALPAGWKSAVDPSSGQTYYYNTLEKRTTWKKPVANGLDKMFDGVRGITTRMSANFLRGGSSRFGGVGGLSSANLGADNTKQFAASSRATWTQKFAQLAYQISTMEPDLRRNRVKKYPVYVSAPLGTSMDDCLKPSLPGSIIITTQNGLPAAESSVRWLLKQNKAYRPKFHFFVSVSREVNDALSVVETLRDAMCESVVAGHLDIDGLNGRHAHMVDWLGVYIHLTRRKPATIEGDREMLMRSLNPPTAPVSERQLEAINAYIKNRVKAGRLPFDRFLARTQQMVRKRCGADNMAVGYCGSAKVAYSIRASCRALERVKFDGEFI